MQPECTTNERQLEVNLNFSVLFAKRGDRTPRRKTAVTVCVHFMCADCGQNRNGSRVFSLDSLG